MKFLRIEYNLVKFSVNYSWTHHRSPFSDWSMKSFWILAKMQDFDYLLLQTMSDIIISPICKYIQFGQF